VRWIGRPSTWRYFRGGWANFLSWRNFRRYTLLIPKAWWTDIFAQTFIWKRSQQRWLMHITIFWGVLLSFAITFPLTFGWIRFTYEPPGGYRAWFFGLPTFAFPVESVLAWVTFHALDFTAVLLLALLLIGFLLMALQLWLLTVALELYLGGHGRDVWRPALLSGAIFLGGLLALTLTGRRPRIGGVRGAGIDLPRGQARR
jgi:hypothetical protein